MVREAYLWRPSEEQREAAHITTFIRNINKKYSKDLDDYRSLHKWSIENSENFWREIWSYGEVKGVLGQDNLNLYKQPTQASWFNDSLLNFAENLLLDRSDNTAIISRVEDQEDKVLTYASLYDEVSKVVQYLEKAGVEPGDRIAGLMSNTPETMIAMLAATAIGAIWTSVSPDFGSASIVERFAQTTPKILFTMNAYCYKSKWYEIKDKIEDVISQVSSIEQVVCVIANEHEHPIDIKESLIFWSDILSRYTAQPIEFKKFPFNHPLYILYSSGTTGKPKCIVHRAGGVLLQHIKEHQLHCDIRAGDRVFYFTTCGWMMWNWLASALASQACIVLYEGCPSYPDMNALWNYASQYQITLFGTSAKYISAMKKARCSPTDNQDLSNLRMICSTGSVLPPEGFDYVYESIKSDVCLASISGGTDICSCFVLGNPIEPVYRGQSQCRGLGMDVQVFNEEGEAVQQQQGELVCLNRFPCQPIQFWGDSNGERYHKAYFNRLKNVWLHGDWIEQTEQDGYRIYGRSDATLNPGGVRIGTAEIYRYVETLSEVIESIAVGQDWDNDVRIILFVRLAEGCRLDETLREKICNTIRHHCTPRHVPSVVVQVDDIPRTRSGKIAEIAVRETIHGRVVGNKAALANPEVLDQYKDLSVLTE